MTTDFDYARVRPLWKKLRQSNRSVEEMIAEYFYSLSLDFPTYFNQSQLVTEIIASSISTPFVAILVDGDGIDIIFDSALSVPDEATLNSVVASHAPVPDAPPPDQTAPPIQPEAIIPPTTNNDSSVGFEVGSVWVDTVTKVAYVCTDATTGAAVWKPITSSMTNVGAGAGESYKDTTAAGVFEMKTVSAGTGMGIVDNTNDVSVNMDIAALTPTVLVDLDGDYLPFYSVGDSGHRKIHPVDLFATLLKSTSFATAPTVNDDTDAGYTLGSIWVDTTTDIAYVLVDGSSGAAIWKEASIQLGSSAPANVTKAAAAVGTSLFAARADHKHDIATGVASTVGTANAEGTATSLARSDHVHDHGAQTNQLHHALVTGSLHGFMSSADKTKIDFSNIIANRIVVQVNPGVGEFSSINAAIASITTNSVSNPFLICVGPGVFTETPITMKQFVYVQGSGDQVTNVVCSVSTGKCVSGIDNSGILDCNLSGATGTGGIAVYFESLVGSLNPFMVRDCVFGSNETLVKAYGSVAPTILQIDGVRFGGATDAFTNGFICECAPGVAAGLSINNVSYMDIVPPTNTIFSRTSGNMASTVFTNSTIRITPTVGTTAFYTENGGDVRMSSSYIRGFDIGLHVGNVGTASNVIAQAVVFVEAGTYQILVEHPSTTGHFFGSYLYEKISIPEAAPFYIDKHNQRMVVVAKKGGDFESIAAAVDAITDAGPTVNYTVVINSGVYTEPLIDLSAKPYISLVGPSIQGVTIIPDGAHDAIHVSTSNEISFLTIQDVPTGYAGIVCNDSGDYGQCHKVSFYDVDIGIKVISSTQDTIFFGEYIDFNGDFTYAVYIEANNGFRAFANLENYYAFPLGAAAPTGVYITGPGASSIVLASGNYGEGVGKAFYVQDGGALSTIATEITNWDTGVHVGNVGAAPLIKVSLCSDNVTYDVNVEHPSTTGSVGGSIEASKVVTASTTISLTFNDPVDIGFVNVGKVFLGPTPDTLVDSLSVLHESPCMGVYSGGVLSDGGGLDISVSAGNGYYSPSVLMKKEWTTSTLTLPADSSVYVYFNTSGVLTSNVTIPDTRQTILLGKVVTGAASILYIQRIPITGHHYSNRSDRILREGFGVIYVLGSIATESGVRNLDVSNGEYYFAQNEFLPSGGAGIAWGSYYRSASPGVYTLVAGVTTVDNAFYDDGSGTLAAIPATEYAKHLLYVIGDGTVEKYIMVYAQDTYATQLAAEAAANPIPPSFISDAFAKLSGIVIQQGNASIVSFIDERPRPSFAAAAVSGGVTDHGALSGLGDDDHTQYIRVDGSRPFTGNQSVGGFNLTSVGNVNGIVVETHGSRHLPNGADPITTAAPSSGLTTVTTNSVGIANSLARSDHSHAIASAAPITQIPNQTNAIGSSTSFARSDHVHTIPTGTAVSIGSANSAGSAATFAASDHVHQGIHSLAVNGGTARYNDINFANGSGVTIVDGGAGTFTISASGESNTASNVGSGADIFKQKTGVDLEFRGITGAAVIAAAVNVDNIDLTVNSSTLGNQVLLSSGTIAVEPTWGALPLGNTDAVTGTLAVANGGTGATTLTSGNVLVGNGTGAVTTSKAAPSGDFVGTTDTQTLTNKVFTDSTTRFADNLDDTKRLAFQLDGLTTATTRTMTIPDASGTIALTSNTLGDFASTTSAQLAGVVSDETGSGSLVFATSPTLVTPSISSIVNGGTLTLPTTSDTLVGRTTTDTLENKTLIDTLVGIGNVSDTTKRVRFSVAGVTTGTTKVLTVQNLDGTIALLQNNLGSFASTTSAQLAGVVSDETGSGSLVFGTNPTLTNPTLGAATATSINKVVLTAPATSSTLTIADGKVLTASNSLTFTGTDSSTVSFGAGGNVAYTSGNLSQFASTTSAQLAGVVSDETGSGSLVFATSPTLVTPSISSIVNGGTVTLPTSSDTLVGRSTTDTLTNKTVLDNSFIVADSGDSTKQLQFEVAGVSSATTRTLTVPNASGTIALTNSGLGQFASTTSAQLANVISDETGSGSLVFATSPTLVTPSISSIVNGGTLTLPTSTDTLVGLSISQTLTNKTLLDGTTFIANTSTPTKRLAFDVSGVTAATTRTLTIQDSSGTVALLQNNLGQFASTTSAQLAGVVSDETGSGSLVFATSPTLVTPSISSIVNGGTLTFPTSTDVLVGRATTDSLTNKSLQDSTTVFYDNLTTSKHMTFQLAGITAATTRVMTIPDASGTLVLTDNVETLTNKTMTGTNNVLTASFLKSATTEVSVSAADAPTTGQVLTATSGTAATWQTPAATGVTSVVGTANQITVTGTTTPTLSISTGYIGQTSITTVGTIGTGTWNATTIAATVGGTGQTSYTTGDLLFASGATTLAKLADVATGNALISGGVGTAPLWGKIGLGTHVSGTLGVANGGTGVGASTGSVSVVLSNSPSLITPSISSIVNTGTLTLPTSTDTLVGRATADSLTNKSLIDTTVFYDDLDSTKQMQFQISGITTSTTRTLTVPDASGTLVLTDNAQTLTNKTLTSSLNNVTASGLFTGGGAGTVSVVAATAPTTGQVLTATGASTATWQTNTASGGTVTNVSGTSGRITVVDGTTTPVIDIDTGYIGQSSITTLGTITTGTWNGSTIAPGNGGTGITSYTIGDLIYASGTSTLAKLSDVSIGSYLRSDGVGNAPIWSTLKLPNAATTGDLLYASATNVVSNLADVATGNALISGGVGVAPIWGKIGLGTHVSGTLPVANGGTGVTASTGTVSVVLSNSPTLVTPSISSIVNTGTLTLPTSTDTLVGRATTDSLTNKSLIDTTVFYDDADATKRMQFQLAGVTTATTRTLTVPDASGTLVLTDAVQTLTNKTLTAPTISSIVNTGTLTLPTSTDTLVGRATVDSLTNKSLIDTTVFYDDGDATKQMQFQLTGVTTGTSRTLTVPDASGTLVLTDMAQTLTNKTLTAPTISSIVNTGTLTLPTSTDTLVGRATVDSLTNKSLIDTTVFYDDADATKRMQFQLDGVDTATTRTLTVPNASGTLVLTDNAQTLTNKTMTSSLNNVTASGLFTGGGAGTVSVVAATAPTTGQVLTATSGTTATWQSASGTVTNVSGTSGRITVVNGTTTPVVDIDTGYIGQSSITTLGTITTGTWNGSIVSGAYGGTGQSSYTVGDLLYASGTTTLSKLSDVATGNALISGGVGVAPLWGKVGLTTHVSGTLPVANGGTGVTVSTGTVSVVLSNSPTLVTPSISSIVNTGTLTLPTSTDTLVGRATADSLTNKSLIDTTVFYDDADATKRMQFQLSGVTTATTRTLTVPDASGTLVLTGNTQSLTNKSLVDTTVFYDDVDTTKQMQVQLSGITTATTRTLTVPNASGTLVLTDNAQTLTNKTLTSSLNNVTASGLFTGGGAGTVSVVAATAPTTGQILMATSATTATWQNGAAGTGTVTSVSAGTGLTLTGTATISPTLSLTTPVSIANGGTGNTTGQPTISNNEIGTQTLQNVTSPTYVDATDITLTPGAGTYLVIVSGWGSMSTGSATGRVIINVNGTEVVNSTRHTSSASNNSFATQCIATVADAQIIKVQYLTSSGTYRVGGCTLTLVRLA